MRDWFYPNVTSREDNISNSPMSLTQYQAFLYLFSIIIWCIQHGIRTVWTHYVHPINGKIHREGEVQDGSNIDQREIDPSHISLLPPSHFHKEEKSTPVQTKCVQEIEDKKIVNNSYKKAEQTTKAGQLGQTDSQRRKVTQATKPSVKTIDILDDNQLARGPATKTRYSYRNYRRCNEESTPLVFHGEHGPTGHDRRQHGPREHGPREHDPRQHGPREHGPREHEDDIVSHNLATVRNHRGQGEGTLAKSSQSVKVISPLKSQTKENVALSAYQSSPVSTTTYCIGGGEGSIKTYLRNQATRHIGTEREEANEVGEFNFPRKDQSKNRCPDKSFTRARIELTHKGPRLRRNHTAMTRRHHLVENNYSENKLLGHETKQVTTSIPPLRNCANKLKRAELENHKQKNDHMKCSDKPQSPKLHKTVQYGSGYAVGGGKKGHPIHDITAEDVRIDKFDELTYLDADEKLDKTSYNCVTQQYRSPLKPVCKPKNNRSPSSPVYRFCAVKQSFEKAPCSNKKKSHVTKKSATKVDTGAAKVDMAMLDLLSDQLSGGNTRNRQFLNDCKTQKNKEVEEAPTKSLSYSNIETTPILIEKHHQKQNKSYLKENSKLGKENYANCGIFSYRVPRNNGENTSQITDEDDLTKKGIVIDFSEVSSSLFRRVRTLVSNTVKQTNKPNSVNPDKPDYKNKERLSKCTQKHVLQKKDETGRNDDICQKGHCSLNRYLKSVNTENTKLLNRLQLEPHSSSNLSLAYPQTNYQDNPCDEAIKTYNKQYHKHKKCVDSKYTQTPEQPNQNSISEKNLGHEYPVGASDEMVKDESLVEVNTETGDNIHDIASQYMPVENEAQLKPTTEKIDELLRISETNEVKTCRVADIVADIVTSGGIELDRKCHDETCHKVDACTSTRTVELNHNTIENSKGKIPLDVYLKTVETGTQIDTVVESTGDWQIDKLSNTTKRSFTLQTPTPERDALTMFGRLKSTGTKQGLYLPSNPTSSYRVDPVIFPKETKTRFHIDRRKRPIRKREGDLSCIDSESSSSGSKHSQDTLNIETIFSQGNKSPKSARRKINIGDNFFGSTVCMAEALESMCAQKASKSEVDDTQAGSRPLQTGSPPIENTDKETMASTAVSKHRDLEQAENIVGQTTCVKILPSRIPVRKASNNVSNTKKIVVNSGEIKTVQRPGLRKYPLCPKMAPYAKPKTAPKKMLAKRFAKNDTKSSNFNNALTKSEDVTSKSSVKKDGMYFHNVKREDMIVEKSVSDDTNSQPIFAYNCKSMTPQTIIQKPHRTILKNKDKTLLNESEAKNKTNSSKGKRRTFRSKDKKYENLEVKSKPTDKPVSNLKPSQTENQTKLSSPKMSIKKCLTKVAPPEPVRVESERVNTYSINDKDAGDAETSGGQIVQGFSHLLQTRQPGYMRVTQSYKQKTKAPQYQPGEKKQSKNVQTSRLTEDIIASIVGGNLSHPAEESSGEMIDKSQTFGGEIEENLGGKMEAKSCNDVLIEDEVLSEIITKIISVSTGSKQGGGKLRINKKKLLDLDIGGDFETGGNSITELCQHDSAKSCDKFKLTSPVRNEIYTKPTCHHDTNPNASPFSGHNDTRLDLSFNKTTQENTNIEDISVNDFLASNIREFEVKEKSTRSETSWNPSNLIGSKPGMVTMNNSIVDRCVTCFDKGSPKSCVIDVDKLRRKYLEEISKKKITESRQMSGLTERESQAYGESSRYFCDTQKKNLKVETLIFKNKDGKYFQKGNNIYAPNTDTLISKEQLNLSESEQVDKLLPYGRSNVTFVPHSTTHFTRNKHSIDNHDHLDKKNVDGKHDSQDDTSGKQNLKSNEGDDQNRNWPWLSDFSNKTRVLDRPQTGSKCSTLEEYLQKVMDTGEAASKDRQTFNPDNLYDRRNTFTLSKESKDCKSIHEKGDYKKDSLPDTEEGHSSGPLLSKISDNFESDASSDLNISWISESNWKDKKKESRPPPYGNQSAAFNILDTKDQTNDGEQYTHLQQPQGERENTDFTYHRLSNRQKPSTCFQIQEESVDGESTADRVKSTADRSLTEHKDRGQAGIEPAGRLPRGASMFSGENSKLDTSTKSPVKKPKQFEDNDEFLSFVRQDPATRSVSKWKTWSASRSTTGTRVECQHQANNSASAAFHLSDQSANQRLHSVRMDSLGELQCLLLEGGTGTHVLEGGTGTANVQVNNNIQHFFNQLEHVNNIPNEENDISWVSLHKQNNRQNSSTQNKIQYSLCKAEQPGSHFVSQDMGDQSYATNPSYSQYSNAPITPYSQAPNSQCQSSQAPNSQSNNASNSQSSQAPNSQSSDVSDWYRPSSNGSSTASSNEHNSESRPHPTVRQVRQNPSEDMSRLSHNNAQHHTQKSGANSSPQWQYRQFLASQTHPCKTVQRTATIALCAGADRDIDTAANSQPYHHTLPSHTLSFNTLPSHHTQPSHTLISLTLPSNTLQTTNPGSRSSCQQDSCDKSNTCQQTLTQNYNHIHVANLYKQNSNNQHLHSQWVTRNNRSEDQNSATQDNDVIETIHQLTNLITKTTR